nr:ABC transporter permease subunit [uncultured Sellimonas sp.]
MKAVMKREVKNYLKNPLFWVGIVVVIFGLFQILSPYLEVKYFRTEQEVKAAKPENIDDADIMNGYVKSTEEERMDLAKNKLLSMIVKDGSADKKEVQRTLDEICSSGKSVDEISDAIGELYGYPEGYSLHYYYMKYEYHLGTVEEINASLKAKLSAHSYSWYFGRKFADFGGVYLAFFSAVLLAFLFIRDTRRDTYELLHTKPITAGAYIFGKAAGGFLSVGIVWMILVIVFFFISLAAGIRNDLPVSLIEFLIPAVCYMLPNLLMITSVYVIIALIFKNPLPGVPLLFLYLFYSNMGSIGPDGEFGYYGRPLAILVRFPGGFLDTAPPPMTIWNQIFLLVASAVFLFGAAAIWKRRRVY